MVRSLCIWRLCAEMTWWWSISWLTVALMRLVKQNGFNPLELATKKKQLKAEWTLRRLRRRIRWNW